VTEAEVSSCLERNSQFKPITGHDTYSNQKSHFYTAIGKKEFTGVVESAGAKKDRLDKQMRNNKIIK